MKDREFLHRALARPVHFSCPCFGIRMPRACSPRAAAKIQRLRLRHPCKTGIQTSRLHG